MDLSVRCRSDYFNGLARAPRGCASRLGARNCLRMNLSFFVVAESEDFRSTCGDIRPFASDAASSRELKKTYVFLESRRHYGVEDYMVLCPC